MSKETIWTIRPNEELEKYVAHLLAATDITRTSLIETAIKLAGPIILSDPTLTEKVNTPATPCP